MRLLQGSKVCAAVLEPPGNLILQLALGTGFSQVAHEHAIRVDAVVEPTRVRELFADRRPADAVADVGPVRAELYRGDDVCHQPFAPRRAAGVEDGFHLAIESLDSFEPCLLYLLQTPDLGHDGIDLEFFLGRIDGLCETLGYVPDLKIKGLATHEFLQERGICAYRYISQHEEDIH